MTADTAPAELNLTNWDLGGRVSEWSYRHADQLFATASLTPGVLIRPGDRPADNSVPPELAEDLNSGLVSAITILAGGRPVFRWSTQPAGRHLLMSVSKVLTSLAIGLLADQDKIDCAAPVRNYLPELGDQWRCRVQHILDMASGVDCPEVGDPGAYSDPTHPFYRFEATLGWRPNAGSDSPYDLVLGYDRRGEPGTRYEYTSVNTFLLAWIVERVTGLGYADALQHLIWDRLSLAHESAICVNSQGTPVSYGGLIMNVDDLARFGTLFTPSAPPEPHALEVPDGYLQMLRTPRDQLADPRHSWPDGAHPAGQWNLVHPNGDMFKSGFGGQGLFVSPAHDVVMAFCGVPDPNGQTHQLSDKCSAIAVRLAPTTGTRRDRPQSGPAGFRCRGREARPGTESPPVG